MSNRYPIYIPSKGRYESRLTMKALNRMGIFYYVVVEEQEYNQYAQYIPKNQLLVLDKAYQDNYDTCDNLGYSKSKGSGGARNFAWEHALANGHEYYWCIDDNIRHFLRYNDNYKARVLTSTFFNPIEDFVDRYENLLMAGCEYEMFVPKSQKFAPITFNTRIYSCNLIKTTSPFRWRGRYNEDTILSLDILKAGYCTALFKSFLAQKRATGKMKGGNTDTVYKDGTFPKSKMLVNVHPDVSRLAYRYGRWHHVVNYEPFKANKLIKKAGIEIPIEPNEYGMILRDDIDWEEMNKKS